LQPEKPLPTPSKNSIESEPTNEFPATALQKLKKGAST
jgi:hypothetical protein